MTGTMPSFFPQRYKDRMFMFSRHCFPLFLPACVFLYMCILRTDFQVGKGKEDLSGKYYLLFRIKSYNHSNENKEETTTDVSLSSAWNQMCLKKPIWDYLNRWNNLSWSAKDAPAPALGGCRAISASLPVVISSSAELLSCNWQGGTTSNIHENLFNSISPQLWASTQASL